MNDLKQLLLDSSAKFGTSYSRAELIDLIRGNGKHTEEEAWDLFLELKANINKIPGVLVQVTGRKRGTRYLFSEVAEGTQKEEKEIKGQSKNDHPEDREHIAAHIAFYLTMGARGVSLPKKTGGGVHDNPDMVMFMAPMDSKAKSPLTWISPREEETKILGVEVKQKIEKEADLVYAIQEAKNNSRYFNEAWLAARINEDLHTVGRDLAREYNIGILTWDLDWPAQALILALPTEKTQNFNSVDFFNRVNPDLLKGFTLAQELSKGRILEYSMAARLISCLFFLLTDQESERFKLPESIESAMANETPDEFEKRDKEAFANAVYSVLQQYYNSEYDGETLTDAIIDLGKEVRLKTIPLSKYLLGEISNRLIAKDVSVNLRILLEGYLQEIQDEKDKLASFLKK